MKYLLSCGVITLLFACSAHSLVTRHEINSPSTFESVTATKDFIMRCESEVAQSSTVIAEKDIIFSLSHLNLMDRGGHHYYLLEQESISSLLHSFTEFTYSQCFLIDSKGKIVYSMFETAALGKKVSRYKETPLYNMFFEAQKGTSCITDVMFLPQLAKNNNMFFSHAIFNKKNEFQGLVVCAISIESLGKLLPKSSKIVNRAGIYSYHNNSALILSANESSIVQESSVSSTSSVRIFEDDGVYFYQPLKYKNIEWFVAVQ